MSVSKKRRLLRTELEGGKLGVPADFLIAGDGRVPVCRYGDHIHDQ
jgi:hypothetical protein